MIDIGEYSYKYETHLHTKEGSACAVSSAEEMAEALKKAGYAGFFVTNHAWGGNTSVDRSLPWREWVEKFAQGYYKAKDWGDKNDINVMFGYESGYEGTEFLIYGITPSWMADHSELHDASIREQLKIIHSAGGMVIQAHPYREEWYIPQIRLCHEYADGIEGVNATHSSHLSTAHNNPEYDVKAIALAKKYALPMTAGSDVHSTKLFGGGMMFKHPVATPAEFISIIRSDEMYLMTDGDRIYDRYGNILKNI